MCYTIPDLTYLRHVDGDGRRARAENEEEEGDPSARNCETTNNHWRIERIECGRCNNWAVSYSVGRVLFVLFGRRAEKNKIYFFFFYSKLFFKKEEEKLRNFPQRTRAPHKTGREKVQQRITKTDGEKTGLNSWRPLLNDTAAQLSPRDSSHSPYMLHKTGRHGAQSLGCAIPAIIIKQSRFFSLFLLATARAPSWMILKKKSSSFCVFCFSFLKNKDVGDLDRIMKTWDSGDIFRVPDLGFES